MMGSEIASSQAVLFFASVLGAPLAFPSPMDFSGWKLGSGFSVHVGTEAGNHVLEFQTQVSLLEDI